MAQSLLKAEGLEFTLEEIKLLGETIAKVAQKRQDGELSDADLEDVAGGVDLQLAGAALFTVGVVGGTLLMGAGALENALRNW